MDITKLSFVVRRRSSWEVFDLTTLMVKANFLSMLQIVTLLYIPIAGFLWLLFSAETASLILWWLKPLLERPLLDFLAKKSLSQSTTAWSCIKSIRSLSLLDIVSMLTINRFSPNRAYLAAIDQLERLKGNAKSSRKRVLLHKSTHKQTFWMLFCVHVELLIAAVLLLAVYNFIPQGVNVDEQFIMTSVMNGGFDNVYYLTYLIAIQIMALYYVTGGFLAYINTRVHLEGWDLELAFKQIASRVSKASVLVAILLFTGIADVSPVRAEEPVKQEAENPTRLEVEKIYQEHELIEVKSIWQPIPKEADKKSNSDPAWLKSLLGAILGLGKLIGYVFWIIVIALIIWVAIKLYHFRKGRSYNPALVSDKKPEVNIPTLFADIIDQNWPDDLLQAAQDANKNNSPREALAYILRFSLLLAQRHSPINILPSMTEKECEKLLLNVLPEGYHLYYRKLFTAWVQQAWAHKAASEEQISELIVFFRKVEHAGGNDE